jgi:hypothetical protein
MRAMPLPCKILKNKSSSVVVDVRSFGTITKDTISINPHSIGETYSFNWVNLSYEDVQTIEASLLGSKGTERFNYLGGIYSIEDGYSIDIQANKPTIQASFVRIQ